MLKVTTNYTQTFQIKLDLYNLKTSWLSVILLAAATLFFAGCEKGRQGIGAEVLPPDDLIDFAFSDTSTIQIETIIEDSINTYRATDLLFGNYGDPEFGRIKATAYTEVVARSGLDFGDPSTLVLDSVVFFIGIRDAYGRLDLDQNIEIFELDERVLVDDEASSNRPLATKGPNLAQGFSISYDTAGVAQLYAIKLDNAFGQRFFTEGQGKLGSASEFRDFFKGFAISTETVPFVTREPGAIYSFDILDGTTFMRFHYQKIEGANLVVQNPEPLIITSSTARYTGITRTETEGKLLTAGTTRPELVDQLEFIQAGAFVKNYLKFPNLDKMPLVVVSRAELVLSVDTTLTGSNQIFSPPAQIAPTLSGPDKVEVLDEFGFPVDVEFNLSAVASYNASNGTYSFDLTGYVQRIISKQQENNGIILIPSGRDFTVNRAIFGGVDHPTLKAKLNLTYSSLPQ